MVGLGKTATNLFSQKSLKIFFFLSLSLSLLVIGRQGDMINKLQADSGAKIQVAPGMSHDSHVTVLTPPVRWIRGQRREIGINIGITGHSRVSHAHSCTYRYRGNQESEDASKRRHRGSRRRYFSSNGKWVFLTL